MFPRHLLILPFVPVLLILVGTLGYHLIEGLPLLESLYLTVVTLATIGYGDIVPHTQAGRVFTMVLILGGSFTLFYSATEVIRAVASGELRQYVERHKMEQSLANLNQHIIVCGYGRVGVYACQELEKQSLAFVVIDHDPKRLESFSAPHGISLPGDATSDEVLLRAGIKRAKALISVASSDADNLYITMSARLLNSSAQIIARAEDPHAEQKLLRAGANRVISPYVTSGLRVVQAVLRPSVVDFIDLATRIEHLELQIEELLVSGKSALVGLPLQETKIRKELGLIILAIKKPSGHMQFNPPPETTLEVGDTLIVVGDRRQLTLLEKMTGD
jgi:voltage-gated potassium channel